MSKPILYVYKLSPPARSVRLLADFMNLDLQIEYVCGMHQETFFEEPILIYSVFFLLKFLLWKGGRYLQWWTIQGMVPEGALNLINFTWL